MHIAQHPQIHHARIHRCACTHTHTHMLTYTHALFLFHSHARTTDSHTHNAHSCTSHIQCGTQHSYCPIIYIQIYVHAYIYMHAVTSEAVQYICTTPLSSRMVCRRTPRGYPWQSTGGVTVDKQGSRAGEISLGKRVEGGLFLGGGGGEAERGGGGGGGGERWACLAPLESARSILSGVCVCVCVCVCVSSCVPVFDMY